MMLNFLKILSKQTLYNVVISLFSFLTITFVIAKFGVETYGQFSIFQNTIFLVSMMGVGWLNQSILRFNDSSEIFRIGLMKIFRFTSFMLSIIGFVLLFFLTKSFMYSTIGTLVIFFQTFSSIKSSFYLSNLKVSNAFSIDLVRVSSFLILVIGLFFIKNSMTNAHGLEICFFVSYITVNFFIITKEKRNSISLLIKERFEFPNFELKKILNNEVIRYGAPFAVWFVASHLLNISDRYIIKQNCSVQDLGIYSALYDIVNKVISFLFMPAMYIMMPYLKKEYESGKSENVKKILFISFFAQLFVLAIILFGLYMFESLILRKASFFALDSTSYSLFYIISISSVIWQIAMLAHKPLELSKRTDLMVYFILISLIVNVGLNLVFIPQFGIAFAAWSSLICSIIYLLLVLFFISKKSGIKIYEKGNYDFI